MSRFLPVSMKSLEESVEMDIGVTLFLILINVVFAVCNHKYSNDKGNLVLNPHDFAKITDADIRLLLQAMDKQKEISQVHDTSKYCRSFESCEECVKSMWYPCKWCHDYGCTDKSPRLCPLSSNGISGARNTSACPYIQSTDPIFVPSGTKKHIEVKINIPDPALLDNDLECQVNLKDQMIQLKGVIMKNVVYCFPLNLVITEGSEVGSFSIMWGGMQPLSNEIPLVAYRCDALANDCEHCRQLPQEYGCGWCEQIQKCSLPNKCNDLFNWAFNRMTCQLNNKQMYFV